jgi:hypothetical protein
MAMLSAGSAAAASPFCRPIAQRAIESILRRHRGRSLRRSWIEIPYGEEEITRLEEEVLPAIAACLAPVEAIDSDLEAAQMACRLPGWSEISV